MKNIESERLIIRDWQESDAPELYTICLDPALQRSGVGFYRSIDECLNTIHLWREQNEMKAIIRKEDDCLIGLIGLGDMNRYSQYKELEFAITAGCRDKGYATEALMRMLAFGFDELSLLVVAAWVRSFNVNSVRVLEKCAFTYEGRLRKHARDQGDTLCYSILKEEWEEFEKRLF
jgi:[ribosomal protein S5]-alanine N-acetyltransferase